MLTMQDAYDLDRMMVETFMEQKRRRGGTHMHNDHQKGTGYTMGLDCYCEGKFSYTDQQKGIESTMGQMHDSGERREFATGAVRDRGDLKPRMVLISPFAMRRLGEWLRLGEQKYSSRNWEKGIPFSDCLDSSERHLNAVKAGDTNEDHLAAIMCNTMFVMHYQEMIKRGVLPASLNDLPDYHSQNAPDSTKEPK